jgi:hypothetical protein
MEILYRTFMRLGYTRRRRPIMISAISTATSGLLAASRRLDSSADRIANANTTDRASSSNSASSAAANPDVSLISAVTDAVDAKAQTSQNAAVLRTADDTSKRLLDIRV